MRTITTPVSERNSQYNSYLSSLFPLSVLVSALCILPEGLAQEVEFDPSFLNMSKPEQLDIQRFNKGAVALPGHYRADIWFNNEQLTRETITVKDAVSGKSILCVSPSLLQLLPLKAELLKREVATPAGDVDSASCVDLAAWLPEATVEFDSNSQRLDISIPQLYVNNSARGSVVPSLWDNGIPAAILGYTAGGYSSKSGGREYKSAYASINSGLNIGTLYFRHNGTYNWQDEGEKSYDSLNTYVRRDIPTIRGHVLLGQANTQGQLFDTVPFSGASVFSDDRMLPESQRGYAPEIRGIARTNALVKIRQNGSVIYETSVPPGAFLIDDLYPTGYGGALDVTIEEADGSRQTFEVPYAAVAQLLRPGSYRYSFTTGKLRDDYIDDKPFFSEATWQQGLTNRLTGYIGAQSASDYYAGQLGMAVGTPIGAVAADVTHTDLKLRNNGHLQGQSWRLTYSKYLPETRSNFSLATYRYSTKNYYSLSDAMSLRTWREMPETVSRPRNRATLTFSQGLGDSWGQLYISGSVQDYWEQEGRDQQYQAGYNGSVGAVSYGISTTRSRNGKGKFENSWLFSLSMPLGRVDYQNYTPMLRTQLTRDADGKVGEGVNVSGTTGEDHQFSYGVDGRHHSRNGYSSTLTGAYRSPWSNLSASWSEGRGYSSQSVGMSGTAIAHRGGVSFSPYIGETFALVEAKGAKGASVSTYPGVKIDSWGYAIVPNLDPYQMNEISINPKGMSNDVELLNTRHKVAPYAGAVVKVGYDVRQGKALMLTLLQANGQPVPFGTEIRDEQENSVGYVGQAGQFLGQVQNTSGRLHASWTADSTQRCYFNYQIADAESKKIPDVSCR